MTTLELPATASGYFGEMVASYDSLIARTVPRYAEMTDRLLAYLPSKARRILELGCGTGNLTLPLVVRYPAAQIIIVDAAPEMIQATRNAIATANGNILNQVQFVTARFEDLTFPADSFDLVASCISLHHVIDKATLYRNICAWLAPSGAFRFADQFRGATEEIHSLNWFNWLQFLRAPGHCSEPEVQSLLDHAAAHDHYTPINEHLDLLTEAGFRRDTLDCVWRNNIWGVLTADR